MRVSKVCWISLENVHDRQNLTKQLSYRWTILSFGSKRKLKKNSQSFCISKWNPTVDSLNWNDSDETSLAHSSEMQRFIEIKFTFVSFLSFNLLLSFFLF